MFWEFVRLLDEIKPKYFLLENVRMHKRWSKLITDILGIEPLKINSSRVVPQNRFRNYWTNITTDLPDDSKPELSNFIRQAVRVLDSVGLPIIINLSRRGRSDTL